MDPISGLDQELEELKQQYRASIAGKLEKIKVLIEAIKRSANKETFSALHFEVHKIAGSAGLYGFAEASILCQAVDQSLLGKIRKSEACGNWAFQEEEMLSFYDQLTKCFTLN